MLLNESRNRSIKPGDPGTVASGSERVVRRTRHRTRWPHSWSMVLQRCEDFDSRTCGRVADKLIGIGGFYRPNYILGQSAPVGESGVNKNTPKSNKKEKSINKHLTFLEALTQRTAISESCFVHTRGPPIEIGAEDHQDQGKGLQTLTAKSSPTSNKGITTVTIRALLL